MGGKDKLICPLIEAGDPMRKMRHYCRKEECAWWDDPDHQCIIITMGRKGET